MRILKKLMLVGLLLPLISCAALSPSYQQPQISITSFNLAPPTTGTVPDFLIGLQVTNPNRQPLSLKGMSYSVEVENHRILSGAEVSLPSVPSYGTAKFVISGTPDLVSSSRLINHLLSARQDKLGYRFKARLDVGAWLPFITIEEAGQFGLGTNQKH